MQEPIHKCGTGRGRGWSLTLRLPLPASRNPHVNLRIDGLPWEEVKDFQSSQPEDRVFVLLRDQGRIEFGDGERGRIPPSGVNHISAYYREGGGRAGNSPEGENAKGPAQLVYLDIWTRAVTRLEDPVLVQPALDQTGASPESGRSGDAGRTV
jgi:hypothetical protein